MKNIENEEVQNMVDNNENSEDICMICHRRESQAGKMIKFPGNFCVCDECMHKTMEMFSNIDFDPSMLGKNGNPTMPFGFCGPNNTSDDEKKLKPLLKEKKKG